MGATTWPWLWSSCHCFSSTCASLHKIQIRSSRKRESRSSSSSSPPRSGVWSTQSWPGFPASPWLVTGTLANLLHVMDTVRMKSVLSLPPVGVIFLFFSSLLQDPWISTCDKWLTRVDIAHGACNMIIDIAVLAIPVFSRSMWVTADEELRSRLAMISLYILGGLQVLTLPNT